MKRIILFTVIPVFFLIIAPSLLQAQVTFQKTYGGGIGNAGNCVRRTVDGGYIILGLGGDGIYVLKTDSNGAVISSVKYGEIGTDYGFSIEPTVDGGFILVGTTASLGGSRDVYLIKFDVLGNISWSNSYGGSSGEVGLSVQQANDGGYIVLGFTQSFGGLDIYLFKTDSMGSLEWSRTFNGAQSFSNVGSCVRQTIDGGYIITGSSNDPELLKTNMSDVWLIKADSLGNLEWGKRFDTGTDDFGYCVQQTLDSGYIITGETYSTYGGAASGVFLIKTDFLGDTLWTRTYGHIVSANDNGGKWVEQTTDGGYIITGYSQHGGSTSGVYLIKTDAIGDTLWTKTYSGEVGNSVQQTADGGYIIAGKVIAFGPGGLNIYLIKTDSLGNSGEGCRESRANTKVGSVSWTVISPTASDSAATVETNVTPSVSNLSITENDECDTTVSVSPAEELNGHMELYPNPTTGRVVLSNLPGGTNKITVYNVLGESVYDNASIANKMGQLNGNEEVILDVSFLRSGTYFIQIEYLEGVLTKKLLKQD